jgi:hypothetical protein
MDIDMLEVAHGLVMKVMANSMEGALEDVDDPAGMAAAVLLATGYGTHPIRVDALMACSMPSCSMGSSFMQCKFPGCSCSLLCKGNALEQLPDGDWELKLVHHKSAQPGDAPFTVVWPADSMEGQLFTAWRKSLYSGQPHLSFTTVDVAPLLLHPQSLKPISEGNWASAWQWALDTMCFRLGEVGGLTLVELDSLIIDSKLLPKCQQQLRHLWASLMDSRLVNQQPSLGAKQLKKERKRLAMSMGSSLTQWLQVYTKGYHFWSNISNWERWDESLKMFHIQDVLEECKEVRQAWAEEE